MRAVEFVAEIGDSPAKHEPNRRRRRSLFHATVDGHWVDVFFDRSDLNGTLHITFTVNNNYEAPRQPTRASGSAIKILSTVLDIIRQRLPEYIRTARPPAVSFTAKEDGRARLYRRYFVPVMQDILGPKWELTEYPNMGMTVFNWRPVKQARTDINEIGAPGELDVSEKLQRYFTDRGYDIAGEGRDQMVFHRPGQRHVIKVIGLGDDLDRRDSVADYVRFFAMNQNNPHYPRVSPPREIQVGDEIYTIYRQELLQSLPGEEAAMDWMEKFGAALSDPAQARAWIRENPPPQSLPVQQVLGLYRAVRRLQQFYGDHLGGSIQLDLSHVGNFMQRADGTIVMVDPLTYDESYDTYSESVADVIDMWEEGSREISRWLEENPALLESQEGWSEIKSLFDRITGDQPVVGKRYSVLNLVAVLPVRFLLQQGYSTPATLIDTIDRGSYQQYEFDIDGQRVRYPEDHRAGDQLSRTFLFQDPAALDKIQTVIALSLRGWEIRNRLSENFADGRKPGRKGLAKRMGVNCKQPVSKLRKIAKNSSGERSRMAHWCANMKSGQARKKK